MTTSDKADRKALPPPSGRRAGATTTGEHVEPAGEVERILADLLAATLGVDRVSTTAHLFDDLGANSLLLAQFSAKVGKHGRLAAPSMQQIYQNPTIVALAAALDGGADTSGAAQVPLVAPEVTRVGTARYLMCGVAQLLLMVGYAGLTTIGAAAGLTWVQAAPDLIQTWQRAVILSVGGFLALAALPVLAKWLLVGRWKAREFPLWGGRYLRLWLVRTLMRVSPAAAFVGTPVYNLYLRALGARVGRGAVILTRTEPVATDLITVGPGAIVNKDVHLTGYRAEAGRIRTGPVTVGANAVVAEQTVLDVYTIIGDGAQLGHASSLHRGQAIPDGESWHGTPARPGGDDQRLDGAVRCGRMRRFLYGTWRLVSAFVLVTPAAITLAVEAFQPVSEWLTATGALPSIEIALQAGDPMSLLPMLGWVSAVYLGGLLAGLVSIAVWPRLLRPFVRADVVYPLYGLRYGVHRTMLRMTNSRFYTFLFGDSSAIPHYLRSVLGYRFAKPWVQSGSNFGVEVKHESAALTTVGSGTMVSDGLSIGNAEYSNNGFRLSKVVLGDNSFFGNNIVFPAGARTGENCLFATKVRVPIDGPLRRDVGLLGSPAFEIPRSVDRDAVFDEMSDDERRRRLRAKNRHNAVTAGIFLATTLVELYIFTLLGVYALQVYPRLGLWVFAAASLIGLVSTIALEVLLERASTGFRRLQPRFCSVLAPHFRRHERFWKMSQGMYLQIFDGTPMKNLLWRALGVRIGRRVFDDGCAMPEKTLVTIGDDVTLNAGTTVQAHSLEDGAFKSDYIAIGAGSTVAPYAFVHYGVTIGDETFLDTDGFLMKGTETAPRTQWSGNPATEQRQVGQRQAPPSRQPDEPRPQRPRRPPLALAPERRGRPPLELIPQPRHRPSRAQVPQMRTAAPPTPPPRPRYPDAQHHRHESAPGRPQLRTSIPSQQVGRRRSDPHGWRQDTTFAG